MIPSDWIFALVGGLIIGLSVTMMLLFNGRVTGIAGIIYGIVNPVEKDRPWRISFLLGLIVAGFIMKLLKEDIFLNLLDFNLGQIIIAGFLVGFGTVLGSGCTSGHGVCGLSRLSPRSLLATLMFMGAGILTVYILRVMGVLS